MSWFAAVLCLRPLCAPAFAQQPAPADVQSQSDRRIPERAAANAASLQGRVRDQQGHAVPVATLTIRSLHRARTYISSTDVEGIFRLRDMLLGFYELRVTREGFETLIVPEVQLQKSGLVYGEIVDSSHNSAFRVFNIGIVLFGVAITVYAFSVVAAFLVEVEVTNPFWRRSVQKRIDELKDHFIVCGLGDTGRYAVAELQKTSTPYVVVDLSEEHLNKLRELHSDTLDEMLYVIGDATEEEVLQRAGLERARPDCRTSQRQGQPGHHRGRATAFSEDADCGALRGQEVCRPHDARWREFDSLSQPHRRVTHGQRTDPSPRRRVS